MSESFGELNALLARTQDRIEAGDVEEALRLEERCQALLERIAGDVEEHGLTPEVQATIPTTQAALDRVLVLLATVKLETRVSLEEVRHERGKLGGYRAGSSRSSRDWTA